MTGLALGIGLTNDCNLACAHCYRDAVGIDRLSLDQVKAVCESIPIKAVNFGVGENALHPEFKDVLHYLAEREIKITITSNGYSTSVLSDGELQLFHDVEFSLDFPTEREQDAFRGAGNWRLIWEQVERCRQAGVEVAIIAVMMSVNYDRLADIAGLAAARGARFRVNVYQPVQTDAFTLSYEQFWTGFKKLFAETQLLVCNEPIVGAVLGLKGGRRSGCGTGTVRVSPRGEVLPCTYWPERTLRIADLQSWGEHIVESPSFRRVRTVPEFCRSCEFVETCGGGCAGRRMLRGQLGEPDKYCPFVRGEKIDLPHEFSESRDFPKAASACTTVVQGRAQRRT